MTELTLLEILRPAIKSMLWAQFMIGRCSWGVSLIDSKRHRASIYLKTRFSIALTIITLIILVTIAFAYVRSKWVMINLPWTSLNRILGHQNRQEFGLQISHRATMWWWKTQIFIKLLPHMKSQRHHLLHFKVKCHQIHHPLLKMFRHIEVKCAKRLRQYRRHCNRFNCILLSIKTDQSTIKYVHFTNNLFHSKLTNKSAVHWGAHYDYSLSTNYRPEDFSSIPWLLAVTTS